MGGNPGEAGCEADENGDLSTQISQCVDQKPCCNMDWSGWSISCCEHPEKGLSQRKVKINKCDENNVIIKDLYTTCPASSRNLPVRSCDQLYDTRSYVMTDIVTTVVNTYERMANYYQYESFGRTFRFIMDNGFWRAEELINGRWTVFSDFEEHYDTQTYYYRIGEQWFTFDDRFYATTTPSSWLALRKPRTMVISQPVQTVQAPSYISEYEYKGSYTLQGVGKFSYERNGNQINWFKHDGQTMIPFKVERKYGNNKFYYNFKNGFMDNWYVYKGATNTLEKVSWTTVQLA